MMGYSMKQIRRVRTDRVGGKSLNKLNASVDSSIFRCDRGDRGLRE